MNPILYRTFVRPALFRMSPEAAHDFTLRALAVLSRRPALLRLLGGKSRRLIPPWCGFGLSFPNRIGLAAGFDKNGLALPAWEALGFGYTEIGTVTALAQPGNPRPRVFRLPEQRAVINRLGFNNLGAEAVAAILKSHRAAGRWPKTPVGINIGKSKLTPLEQANADYAVSLEHLHVFADYLAINVSSPNTPNLRELQHGEALASLLHTVKSHRLQRDKPVPIFLKIAPDLEDDDLRRIAHTATEAGIDGIIATNTTINHESVPIALRETGGLSGAPLTRQACNLLANLKSICALPIIGVGGIMTGADAAARFEAGATLVQIYTGMIYEGPDLVRAAAVEETRQRPR